MWHKPSVASSAKVHHYRQHRCSECNLGKKLVNRRSRVCEITNLTLPHFRSLLSWHMCAVHTCNICCMLKGLHSKCQESMARNPQKLVKSNLQCSKFLRCKLQHSKNFIFVISAKIHAKALVAAFLEFQ